MTLKQKLLEAIRFYEAQAAYEKKRAEQATKWSNIQDELRMASKYNEGRANAMREALKFVEENIG